MSSGHGESATIRVLLVDGHRMVAEALAAALDERPPIRTVGIAARLADARTMVTRLMSDVLLLSDNLDDGAATAAARELLASAPSLKAILLTEGEDGESLSDALDAGFAGCLAKSAPIDELVQVVESVHTGKVLVPAVLFKRVMIRLREAPETEPHGLTPREMDVLQLLAGGWGTRAMAAELHVTVHTLRNYVQAVLQKLDAQSRLEAVVIARRAGLVGRGH